MVFQNLQAFLSGTTANEMLRRRALKRVQIRLSIGQSGSPLRAVLRGRWRGGAGMRRGGR